jgi:hypothetical protein
VNEAPARGGDETMHAISHEMVDPEILETTDIGGTNVEFGNVDMQKCDRVFCMVEIGTWNATDDLDECRLEQGDGSTWKDLTTDASGGNYDTDSPVDADGNQVILEARAEDLDVENGFRYVRAYLAEGGNSGVDNVSGFIFGYSSRKKHAQRPFAAVTGEKVYVQPS